MHYIGLEETFFTSRHQHIFEGLEKNGTSFRSAYYPSLTSDDDLKPGVIRLRAHTDFETITLLFQDGMGGLEVLL